MTAGVVSFDKLKASIKHSAESGTHCTSELGLQMRNPYSTDGINQLHILSLISLEELHVALITSFEKHYENLFGCLSLGDQQSGHLARNHRKIGPGLPALDAQVRPQSPCTAVGRRRDRRPRPQRQSVIGGATSGGGDRTRETRYAS